MVSADDNWPAWPPDAKPQRMVDVQVACSAAELFKLIHAPNSPYVAKSQDKLGNKDYSESFWGSDADILAGERGTAPSPALKPAEYKGLSRIITCSGQGMGMKYVNTELQRCVEASEGGPFEVVAVVQTSATYGDRFRPIIKHRLVPTGSSSCTYTVDYVLIYIANTNGFIKKAIERGAVNGVTKNFEILMELLNSFHTVTRAGEKPVPQRAPSEKTDAKHQQAPPKPRSFILPWWSPRLSPEGVLLMELGASWVLRKTGLHASGRRASHNASTLAVALASVLLLLVTASLLFVLQASQTSCSASKGFPARVCVGMLAALDLPSSLRQILTSGLVLLLANAVLAAASSRLLARIPANEARRLSHDGGVGDLLDDPASGVRYEGFEQSLESAAANITQGEGDLKRRATESVHSSREALRNKGTQLKENLKVGLKSLIEPMKRPKTASPTGTGPSGSSPALPTSAFAANPGEAVAMERAAKVAADGTARLHLTNVGSDASSSALLSDDEEARSVAGLGVGPKRSSGGGGLRDYMNPGGLLDKTENMFAQWSGGAKPQRVTPAQAIPQNRARSPHSDYEAQEEAAKMTSSVTPAMELADLSPRDPEELSGEPVEEEVFENERYQPFRGWGHQWPGHFLPTDRVGHWSTATSIPSPSLDTSSFEAVAPKLKKDWEWLEEGWQIDMRALETNGVDEEGWSYAVDFGWIQQPPASGSGRFRKVRDYVRRRRWFRTRQFAGIQLQDSPRPKAPASPSAASTSAPARSSLLTEALNSDAAGVESDGKEGAPLSLARRSADREGSGKGQPLPPLPKNNIGKARQSPSDAQEPPPGEESKPASIQSHTDQQASDVGKRASPPPQLAQSGGEEGEGSGGRAPSRDPLNAPQQTGNRRPGSGLTRRSPIPERGGGSGFADRVSGILAAATNLRGNPGARGHSRSGSGVEISGHSRQGSDVSTHSGRDVARPSVEAPMDKDQRPDPVSVGASDSKGNLEEKVNEKADASPKVSPSIHARSSSDDALRGLEIPETERGQAISARDGKEVSPPPGQSRTDGLSAAVHGADGRSELRAQADESGVSNSVPPGPSGTRGPAQASGFESEAASLVDPDAPAGARVKEGTRDDVTGSTFARILSRDGEKDPEDPAPGAQSDSQARETSLGADSRAAEPAPEVPHNGGVDPSAPQLRASDAGRAAEVHGNVTSQSPEPGESPAGKAEIASGPLSADAPRAQGGSPKAPSVETAEMPQAVKGSEREPRGLLPAIASQEDKGTETR